MSATAELNLPPRVLSARPTSSVRPAVSVFLPKEHGSWSLVLEPLALGLLVAPSWAGGALAGAALAGFFARRPLKAALVEKARDVAENVSFSPTRRNETLTRSATARRSLALLVALAVVGMAEVLVLATWTALWPLLPAAGLGAVFVWFDAQGDSRAAAAEVAGSAAFAFVPAALATLAGLPMAVALALAVLALARSVPTVLVVRTCLRQAKGALASPAVPLQASVAALIAAVVLAANALAPWAAVVLAALLLGRALWLLGPRRPGWPAKRLGMMEAALGLFYVAFIAALWASP
jgi:hypothetical protein